MAYAFRMKYSFLLLFLLVLFIMSFYLIQIEEDSEIDYDLIRVIDGDTFEYNNETIRLLCVQTPELGEEGYEESRIFLSSLIYGNELRFESIEQDKDQYGRLLRFVYVEDLFVNKEIIDEGYGVLFEYNRTDCSKIKNVT